MRLHRFRPRFTMRWLLIAVAVVAIGFSWLPMWRQSRLYSARVQELRRIEQRYAALANGPWPGQPPTTEQVRAWHEMTAKIRGLRYQYENAVNMPWLPIEPDTIGHE